MAEKVRFTISLAADVHAQFVKLAEAERSSLSSSVGNWLESTAESAAFMSMKMRKLRMAPAEVFRELEAAHSKSHADLTKTRDMLAQMMREEDIASTAVVSGRRSRPLTAGGAKPPSSPTGVKESPRKGRNP